MGYIIRSTQYTFISPGVKSESTPSNAENLGVHRATIEDVQNTSTGKRVLQGALGPPNSCRYGCNGGVPFGCSPIVSVAVIVGARSTKWH